jgi:hypothetical protein
VIISEIFNAFLLIVYNVFIFFYVASYLTLPQGVLRGKLPGTTLLGEDIDIVSTFLKIFLFNLIVGGIVFSLCNLFGVGNVPRADMLQFGSKFLSLDC